LVPLLTHLLDKAKAGEITAVACAALTTGTEPGRCGWITAISKTEWAHEGLCLLGAVTDVQHSLARSMGDG